MRKTFIPETFHRLVRDRDVFVLGSGVGASLRDCREGAQLLVCVNGSVLISETAEPDILVITGVLARAKHERQRETLRRLGSRRCRHLVVQSGSLGPDDIRGRLAAEGLRWETSEEYTAEQRRRTTEVGLKRPVEGIGGEDVCSIGVAALVLAHFAHARSLAVSGIGFGSGHSYMETGHFRWHRAVDRAICARLGIDLGVAAPGSRAAG